MFLFVGACSRLNLPHSKYCLPFCHHSPALQDKPNGDAIGGDIWYYRDEDGDGIADSLDQIACNRVDGSESSGMAWAKAAGDPFTFYVTLQHPDSTSIEGGFGDAVWALTMPYECTIDP